MGCGMKEKSGAGVGATLLDPPEADPLALGVGVDEDAGVGAAGGEVDGSVVVSWPPPSAPKLADTVGLPPTAGVLMCA